VTKKTADDFPMFLMREQDARHLTNVLAWADANFNKTCHEDCAKIEPIPGPTVACCQRGCAKPAIGMEVTGDPICADCQLHVEWCPKRVYRNLLADLTRLHAWSDNTRCMLYPDGGVWELENKSHWKNPGFGFVLFSTTDKTKRSEAPVTCPFPTARAARP
jgi:hypothetical protein